MEENKSEKVQKEFGLTTLSIKNRTTVFVLTALVVLMGVSAYINLPKESFPEVSQPIVYIGTAHPGNSPVDMENLITRPIEKEVNLISDVEDIKSTSLQDYSTIIIEFTPDTEIEDALTKVKDAVDKAELPNDLENDPDVFEMNISEVPIMNVNLSGDYSIEELNNMAEYLEDEIEKLSEISKVEIRGVDEKEIRINADPYQMEAREVNFSDIENAVREENITLSGGNVRQGSIRRSLRVVGEFKSPDELLDVVIKQEKGNIVYLRDIAEVEFDYKESQSYARLAKQPVVMIDVIKRSGENLLIATDKIHEILDEARVNGKLPEEVNVSITGDQSQDTRDMVESLENNIISGVILVVLVLLFFLGTRNALFVGVAIPLSMFMSFMILGAFGITINMMVLFSLIMALGMLVDNGIVVVENVYRLREEGYNAFEATKNGVGEVALPIIASTSTTLAAFLPLAFWPGIMGEFMKFLPITLIVTLGSSLFVALVINPVLVTVFMKLDDSNKEKKKFWIIQGVLGFIGIVLLVMAQSGFVFDFRTVPDDNMRHILLSIDQKTLFTIVSNLFLTLVLLSVLNVYVLTPISRSFRTTFLPWLEDLYTKTLTYALQGWKPYLFFWGTVGLLAFSLGLMKLFPPPVNFFPETPPKYVNVFIEYPVGTDIEETNDFSKEMEDLVLDLVAPYDKVVESVITNVGEGTADPLDQSAFGQKDTPNKARISVNFVEFKNRGGVNTKVILDTIRASMKGYPGVSVVVDKDVNGPPVGKPISIEISGEEFDVLIDITERMKQTINGSGIKGIEKLKTDMETGKPELVVDIDREKARRFGLSTRSIAMEVRTALFGKEISKYKEGEDDYEIQLRLMEKYRNNVDALMNKSVVFRNQTSGNMHSVPISSVATAEISSTFGSIKRKDLKRVISLTSNVESDYNATEVNDQLKELLADFDMPPGYEFKFGGEQEKQAEEMAFLSKALLIAVFLIFLIIVSQFNKITSPFIIMMSVILSTIGVFMGLITFRMEFSVIMTMIGIISLAGIVVNNAIVLIDFIELSRKRRLAELKIEGKLPFDEITKAIIQAGEPA